MTKLRTLILVVAWIVVHLPSSPAQDRPGPGFRGGRGQGHGPGMGRGMGMGRGFGRGQGAMQEHDERHDEDHQVFEYLLENHDKIQRTVKDLPNGVETTTESTDAEVADHIKEHVEWMAYRIEKSNPIRMRDPLFAELFKHTDKIVMKHEDTPNGVKVIETSEDPYVAKLIQAHARVVSKFVERGFAEAMKNHEVPDDSRKPQDLRLQFPVIEGHGAVVKLPEATHQPRTGTKLLVDITRGGPANELNDALEKVAKYVNIYAGAGKDAAAAQFAIVLHGDATLTVLNPDAYAEEFNTKGNPNVELLRALHEAGVEIYVCGQTLISKGKKPEDVVVFAETAVSALTAVVNLQADGFAYVPLGK